jgi:3-dehydroquinate dehydratase / shikimate dehydrogenase
VSSITPSQSRRRPFTYRSVHHNHAHMTEIVVPIASAKPLGLIEQAQQARAAGADLVEVRLDTCLTQAGTVTVVDELLATISQLALPCLVTLRHIDEGGTWAGEAADREAIYTQADAAGARYIDIELAHHRGWKPNNAGLVLSHHDFHGPGQDLPAIIARMHAAGAAIAKVAVTPLDASDLAAIEACHRNAKGPICAIAMGEIGLPSRLLAGCWGSAFTFARLASGAASAPGQPTVEDLIHHYRLKQQSAETRIFGVIGNPIRHSLSPLIHNAAIADQKIDAVYVPFLVADPVAFWRACGHFIDGLSITIPHKHDLIPEVDRCDPLVTQIGAMNTIWRDAHGKTVGTNTDAVAAITCIESQAGNLQGTRSVLLGAGGVGRAIAFALAERGSQVVIVNRNRTRAETLATEVGCQVATIDEATAQPWDVLVNGTSVGMEAPAETPWPTSAHHADRVVFDTVYTPLETRLIRDAHGAGARTVSGLAMFIGQAAEQYRRFFGVAAPQELMYRVALEQLEAKARAADRRKPDTESVESALGGG